MTPSVNASFASIIIALATPHTATLILDHTFANYYQNLEKRLSEIKDAGTSVVSIGGGPRDILITSAQILDPTADINVLSNTMPDVWKSTDHLSILWCKQLVLSVVRSLFDSVNCTQKPPKIFSTAKERMQALSYHFYHVRKYFNVSLISFNVLLIIAFKLTINFTAYFWKKIIFL